MLENLVNEKQRTEAKYLAVVAKCQTRRNELIRVLEEELKQTFESEMGETRKEMMAAEVALKTARWAQSVEAAKTRLLFPVGTRMCQWTTVRQYGVGVKGAEYKPTGVVGMIEIVDVNSQHPQNSSSWARASVGSIVVRFLLKNGKPGKKYIPCPNFSSAWCEWAPEGVDLNSVRNAEAAARKASAVFGL